MKQFLSILAVLVAVSACSSGGSSRSTGSLTAPPTSYIKLGKPYTIKGRTYRPAYQPNYDKVGVASWYGPGFHGKSTANGERYDKWALTAAHTTLPLPSMVRVTHLKTGRNVVVRVNDRGPFAHNRIIDLSRAAAEEIGMLREGVAKVRVTYLKEETDQLLRLMRAGKRPFEVDIENEVLSKTRLADGGNDLDERRFVQNQRNYNTQPNTQLSVPQQAKRSVWKRFSIAGDANAAEIKQPEVIRSSDLPPLGTQPVSSKPVPAVKAPAPTANKTNGSVYDVLPGEAKPATPHTVSPAAGGNPASATVNTPKLAVPEKPVRAVLPDARYVVKLGTFSDAGNANTLERKLGQSDLNIQTVQVNGRTLYRVSTGGLSSKAEADRVVADAYKLGLKDAYIVRLK